MYLNNMFYHIFTYYEYVFLYLEIINIFLVIFYIQARQEILGGVIIEIIL